MRKRALLLITLILLCGCTTAEAAIPAILPVEELAIVFHDPTDEPLPPVAVEPVFSVTPLPAPIREQITGRSFTTDSPVTLEELSLVTVTHLDFAGEVRTGRIILHQALAEEVCDIFRALYQGEFPIAGVALIEEYDCDDNLSMEANNSYGYCTRLIAGTDRLSVHSYGMAVDLNPVQNPYILSGTPLPAAGAAYLDRTDPRPGMILPGDAVYNAFTSRGWSWGGHWPSPDYQHFEKVVGD